MKANELRIENWLNSWRISGDWIPKQIESGKEIDFVFMQEENIIYKPIPLTEQWLIDFGFKKHTTMDIYPTYSLNNVNINDGVVYIVGFGFVNYIKYVHQLQNLYFALTGIELIKQ